MNSLINTKMKIIGRGLKYDNETLSDLVSLFESKNLDFGGKMLVSTKIIAIEDDFVIVSVNDKYDAVIKKSELKDLEEIKLGVYVDVFIEKLYDRKGQICVSRSKGKIVRLWEDIYNSKNNNFILAITVIEKVPNGVIGIYNNIRIFVPFTQIANYNEDSDIIGQELNVVVIKINKVTGNVIASNKLVLEVKKKELENTIVSQIKEGQIIECVVTNIVQYGAFLNIGGVDFLLYINEISWRHIDSPSEVLKVGDVVKVVVLSINKDAGRINLSLKHLLPNPWDEVVSTGKIKVGDIYEGKVVNILDYGIFVEILDGVEGLVHISEISWGNQNVRTDKIVKLNEIIKVKVINIDLENKRIGLSIRQLTIDPWLSDDFKTVMAEGSKHEGEVIELKQFGCIVKLENDIEALIHISDFSWTQKITRVDKFVQKGDKINVVILSVDHESRKVICGIKQISENPWEAFAKEFEVGTVHKGIIIKKTPKCTIIKLPHDLEGVMFKENCENIKNLVVGTEIEVKVLEFNSEAQKLHLAEQNFEIKENKAQQKKPKKKEFTIGDLTDLSKIGEDI